MFLTYILLIINVGLSLWAFERPELKSRWMFNPYQVTQRREYYRLITHGFIHLDFMHLLFNMYVLYMFGRIVEEGFIDLFGVKGYYYFVLMYFGSMFFSTLPSMIKHKMNPMYNSLGASGAVSGVVFAMIALDPTQELGIIFIPVYFPAIIFGALYLVAEYFLSKRASSNIAHDAHIVGAIFGFVFTIAINWQEFDTFISNIKSIFS